jgi:hypothetical protein
MMAASAVVVALGVLASAAVNAPWQLIALSGLVVGGGTGMIALVLGATVATDGSSAGAAWSSAS